MLEILGFVLGLLLEVVFAIVVRIPQFFFDVLTLIVKGIGRLVKGCSSNPSDHIH